MNAFQLTLDNKPDGVSSLTQNICVFQKKNFTFFFPSDHRTVSHLDSVYFKSSFGPETAKKFLQILKIFWYYIL